MHSGCSGQQKRQGLVLKYWKLEQQAEEESTACLFYCVFFFFFLCLGVFFFPSGFLDVTYPGHIYQVTKPLLDSSLPFPTIY